MARRNYVQRQPRRGRMTYSDDYLGRKPIGTETDDGRGLFPDHLDKANKIICRAHELVEKRGKVIPNMFMMIERYEEGELRIDLNMDSEETTIYLRGSRRIYKQEARLRYVDKSVLDELLDVLQRKMVLDDLGDIKL